ncbi:MAG: LytTR family DNA-binding domain-containing protein [Puia sp.]|nr:LytTR family DNA-binding domain-containing protein [Puia sp.]
MQDFFFIRNAGKFERIGFRDIMYIEACKNYSKIVTDKKSYIVLVTMKKVEAALPFHLFCRVHRSFIVSLEKISAFDNNSVFMASREIPIGDQYRDQLEKRVLIIQRDHQPGEYTAALSKVPVLAGKE